MDAPHDIPTQRSVSADKSATATLDRDIPKTSSARIAPVSTYMLPTIPSHHKGDFRNITLENGEELEIPTSRAADNEAGSEHTRVSPQNAQPSGIWTHSGPASGIRYLIAGAAATAFGFKDNYKRRLLPDITFRNGPLTSISDAVNFNLDPATTFAKRFEDSGETLEVFKAANKKEYDKVKYFVDRTSYARQADEIISTLSGRSNKEIDFNSVIANGQIDNQAIKNMLNDHAQNTGSKTKILDTLKSDFKDNLQGQVFDSFLGTTMALTTLSYAKKVHDDIVKLYAETVAYELYDSKKLAKDINFFDLLKSDNKIVKETCQNYIWKNVARFANDAMFFGRQLGRISGLEGLMNNKFGEMALGAKAVMLLCETQRQSTSLFVDLTSMVDQELNSQRGIASPVKKDKLLDLYQKYESTHNKDKVFSDVTRHDYNDDATWLMSDAIFSRMAELMNQTYKYKNGFDKTLDAEQRFLNDVLNNDRYFPLPKFLYLLGHDLINPSEPEKTLAYVEVANSYSIQDVKNLQRQLEVEKTPLAQALKDHPVDLERTLGTQCPPALVEISQLSRRVDQALINEAISNNAHLKDRYDAIQREKLAKSHVAQTDVAFVDNNILHIPVPATARDALNIQADGRPKLSFFEPRAESFAATNNNTPKDIPDTRISERDNAQLVDEVPKLSR